MRPHVHTRLAARAGAVLATVAATALVSGAAPASTAVSAPSPGVTDCAPSSAARLTPGAKAPEPALYASKDAKKYGVIKSAARAANGSITIETVFHVVSATPLTDQERTRRTTMIAAQVKVLNDAYSGMTSTTAANTPFRFHLSHTTFTVNPTWNAGGDEKGMKRALRQGDSETLNVYTAALDGGLLGYAYFPKGYNNGRDYLDGVVILDESMPGGTATPYADGDTLTHESGHWMALEHTFAGACSASGDGVADTPREAYPQFGCPEGADSCPAPGLDPVHNFMDYTVDSCMDEFTPGQATRMNDAWFAFRAGGNG